MPLLPTIEEEASRSWLRSLWKYRLQFQAMASASAVHVAGGMKLAWTVYEASSHPYLSTPSKRQLNFSWFVGIVVGALLAASCVQRISKNVPHLASGALLLVGGIMTASLPTYFAALLCACLCEGCAYGLTLVQAFVTGGEVAHKHIRGLLLSSERIFLWLGISLQLVYMRLWVVFAPADGHAMCADTLHGVIVACVGVAAVALAVIHRYESPLLLQMQQRDLLATFVLKRLQGAHYPSTEVMHVREECKQLLASDGGRTKWQLFHQQNAVPLFKVVLVRCLPTLSLSLPFNRVFTSVSWPSFGCDINCLYVLPLFGLLGSIVGGFLVDEQGRRKLAVTTLLLAEIFIFIVGGLFFHLQKTHQVIRGLDVERAVYLLLLYQLLVAGGCSVAGSAYISEAFSVGVKAICIAVVVICEQLVQMTLLAIVYYGHVNTTAFFFSIGILCLLLALMIFLFMPETKYLSLTECLQKFKRSP